MAIKRKKHTKGIRIKPNTDALEAEGEITVDSADDKLKAQLGGSDRAVVTEDQTQTLTNKTVDADNNTVSNLEVDNLKTGVLDTDLSTVSASHDTIPSALAVKNALDGQNEASEIDYDNTTSGLTATNVQGAIDEVEGRLDTAETGISDHLADAVDAHDASAISYVNTTSGLAATEVQAAIDEVDGDLDTHIAASTAHGVTGAIVGTTDNQTLSTKVIDNTNSINIKDGSLTLEDNADGTKKLKFDAAGITTATTRTLTAPDADTTIVGTDATQTITNKTIDADNNTISNLAHGAEVDNPSSGVHGVTGSVVGTTDTQDLSGKTFTDAITLQEQGSTPSTPASGDKKLYPKTDGKLYTLDDAGNEIEVGSGGGSGGINYLEGDNSDFETSIGDWIVFDDGSVTIPVDGTGGSPSELSISRNTTTPLRGTADLKAAWINGLGQQGSGHSCNFIIDKADQAKKLIISFDYDFSASSMADDVLAVFVYDITNAQLIRVNGEGIKAGKGTHYAQFQTAPDSTSYRLIIMCSASSTIGTADLFFDNVKVGPQIISHGTIVTDWESYTPTVGGGFTNTVNASRWRRVGENIEIEGSISVTSTGSASNVSVSLPSGVVVDTVGAYHVDGNGNWLDSGVAFYDIRPVIENSASTEIRFYQIAPTNFLQGNQLANNDVLTYHITFKVAGWSSNAKMSEDFGGRELAFRVTKDTVTSTSIPTGTWTAILGLNNNNIEKGPGYDTNNSYYVAPETGTYLFGFTTRISGLTANNGAVLSNFSVNGTPEAGYKTTVVASNVNSEYNAGDERVLFLNKGDIVRPIIWQNSSAGGASIFASDGAATNWWGFKIPSPQTMLETETVAARYTSNSGQVITSTTSVLIFEDLDDGDTHAAYNSSTGVYTAPSSGWYDIDCGIYCPSTTWTAGQFLSLEFVKNGSVTKNWFVNRVQATFTQAFSISGSAKVYLEKGDTFQVEAVASRGGTALITSGSYNFFSIARIK